MSFVVYKASMSELCCQCYFFFKIFYTNSLFYESVFGVCESFMQHVSSASDACAISLKIS